MGFQAVSELAPGSVRKRKLLSCRSGGSSADRIFVKSRNRLLPVRIREIDWIEAAGKYNILHVGAEEHVVRETLASLEKKLPRRQFRRIHRSSIVNVDSIKEIQPLFRGDSCVILKIGAKVTLSRSYRANSTICSASDDPFHEGRFRFLSFPRLLFLLFLQQPDPISGIPILRIQFNGLSIVFQGQVNFVDFGIGFSKAIE
jgi:hypothetical protein